ncbi:hypothetical protein TNCT_406361 [Trichonephila clavata]|uniref:Uncharacterized protein n=1 Tax=Trichonephila clavata TaxID=2740835 RepID=A0A8X6FJP8_TRICU|nr:hypothetical protein TNCT_406361 [Trichonephila clavata]
MTRLQRAVLLPSRMGEKVQSMIGEINTNQEALAWGAEGVIPSEASRKSGTVDRREAQGRKDRVDCVCNQQEERSSDCSPSTTCQTLFEAVCVAQECDLKGCPVSE